MYDRLQGAAASATGHAPCLAGGAPDGVAVPVYCDGRPGLGRRAVARPQVLVLQPRRRAHIVRVSAGGMRVDAPWPVQVFARPTLAR